MIKNDNKDKFFGILQYLIFKLSPLPSSEPPPPCFKKGSKILTFDGETEVENLRVGDLVKTSMDGYLKIESIGVGQIYNSGDLERVKDRLYVLSPLDYPELTRELVLTGAHSILVDTLSEDEREMTIQTLGRVYRTSNKYRLMTYLDRKSKPYEISGYFEIYHLALENSNNYTRYGIYVEGLLVETCSKRYLQKKSKMKLIN